MIIDLTGKRFGRLLVIKRAGTAVGRNGQKVPTWECLCDCGNTATIRGSNLRSGATTSCGCYAKEVFHKRGKDSATHGCTNTRLYQTWASMKRRCDAPGSPLFENYGGRGVKVCDEWEHSFEAFRDWALANGFQEDAKRGDCTLDRIDVDGDYCPSNCRWVDNLTQQNNKRSSKYLEFNGERLTQAEWSRRMGLSQNIICKRLKKGWSIEKTLTTPRKEQGKERSV